MNFLQVIHGFVIVSPRNPTEAEEEVTCLDTELVQRDIDESLAFDKELIEDE